MLVLSKKKHVFLYVKCVTTREAYPAKNMSRDIAKLPQRQRELLMFLSHYYLSFITNQYPRMSAAIDLAFTSTVGRVDGSISIAFANAYVTKLPI